MQMNVIHNILDNHNVKRIDYTVENVQWMNPDKISTHWGPVCIKVEKK